MTIFFSFFRFISFVYTYLSLMLTLPVSLTLFIPWHHRLQ